MPASPREKLNLLGLDRAGLEAFFSDLGERPYRARQILQWVHQRGVTSYEPMTDLARKLRQRLAEITMIQPPTVLKEQVSADGTVKWLLAVAGGNAVETVFIPEPRRGTLCISSQVGCMLNCTFCSTATQGFNRNLTCAEIIGQVWLATQALASGRFGDRRITNVVLMGMGEPLLNLNNVAPALALLRDDLAYGLAAKRVTVSTAGVVPGIDQLRECEEIALAVSLHAPNDELRSRLVPLNRKYPLAELMAACRRFVDHDRRLRSITFEYTMIDGVNDDPRLARDLLKLLSGLPCKLNLIPFNPFPGTPFRTSPMERILAFQEVTRSAGLITTIRKTRGEDIDAACGQLVGKLMSPSQRRLMVQQQLARQAVAV